MIRPPEAVFRSPLRFDCCARTGASRLPFSEQHPALDVVEPCPRWRQSDEVGRGSPFPARFCSSLLYCVGHLWYVKFQIGRWSWDTREELLARLTVAHSCVGGHCRLFQHRFPLRRISGARSGLKSGVVLSGLSIFFGFACILSRYQFRSCRRPRRTPRLFYRCRLVLPLRLTRDADQGCVRFSTTEGACN